MPWCDTCDKFYNPNSLRPDGTCPTCGRAVGAPPSPSGEAASGGAPWHFKLLIAVTVVYLGYRLFQGLVWVAHQL